MKRDFTDENFEDFLKRSADGLRMKAPDKVWQNLSKELNKKRKRFTFGLSAFLLVSSAVGYGVISNLTQPELSTSQPTQKQSTEDLSTGGTNSNTNKTTEKTPSTAPVIRLQERAVEQSPNNSQTVARIIPFTNRSTEPTNPQTKTTNVAEPVASTSFSPTVVDSYTEFDETEKMKKGKPEQTVSKQSTEFPLTIESVINNYKANKRKKFETQFYFTPTISYRKLTENKSYLRSLDPNAQAANLQALNSRVSNNVTHKPDIGFEVGFTTKYLVSKKLKVRSGLQFNVNRYDVKAFSSPLSVTTIALNNGARVDSLNTISGYSNVHGYRSNWLQNLSFQLSAPIGAEFIVSENDETSFGFAATVQPTYVLGDRAYLITTDYKNYTQVPWLIRRWNVNTALEAFVNLQSGKTKWQIGPQVRYQLLSSFISEYPVKENLFDFGLKIGVSLNNR